jgi:hypothetical protein
MIGFVIFLLSLAAPVVTIPFAVLGKYPTWLLTPDDKVSPFGQYEETVRKVYGRFGRIVGDWYWLGLRNRLLGLSYKFKPSCLLGVSSYNHLVILGDGNKVYLVDGDKTYVEKTISLGPFKIISGYRLTPVLNTIREDNPVRPINMDGRPIFSIRRNKE